MNEIKLNRTYKRPLAFIGKEIASASSRDHNSTRWVEASVFETDNGKIVVGIVHITCWEEEHDHYTANVFANKEMAMTHIEEEESSIAEEIANDLGVVEQLK